MRAKGAFRAPEMMRRLTARLLDGDRLNLDLAIWSCFAHAKNAELQVLG